MKHRARRFRIGARVPVWLLLLSVVATAAGRASAIGPAFTFQGVNRRVRRWASGCRRQCAGRTAVLAAVLLTVPTLVSAAKPPIVLQQEFLGIDVASAMAMHKTARRVYIGRYDAPDWRRRNLVVVTLNRKGQLVGTRRYADSDGPLSWDTRSVVSAIVIHPKRPKLYVASYVSTPHPTTGSQDPHVTSYDLDRKGEPIGTPRSYAMAASATRLTALAVNAARGLLYAVGNQTSAVHVYSLDGNGEPQGAAVAYDVGGAGKVEVAVSATADRLYLGTNSGVLQVVDLDPVTGLPNVGTTQSFQILAGGNLLFQYSPDALFLRVPAADHDSVAVVGLGPDGLPPALTPLPADVEITRQYRSPRDGLPQPLPVFRQEVFATQRPFRTLWLAGDTRVSDAVIGASVSDGITVGARGVSKTGTLSPDDTIAATLVGRDALLLALSGRGRAVVLTGASSRQPVNRVADYRLRVTVVDAAPPSASIELCLAGARPYTRPPAPFATVLTSQPSPWVALDTFPPAQPRMVDLQNTLQQVMATVTASTTSCRYDYDDFTQLTLRIEVAQGDPAAGGTLLATIDETVQGAAVQLLLPGYGNAASAGLIESMRAHSERYLAAADAVQVDPSERPVQFRIAAGSVGSFQGSLAELINATTAVSLLGFNVFDATDWAGISRAQIDAVLDAAGFSDRVQGNQTIFEHVLASCSIASAHSAPLFEFQMTPAELSCWAAAEAGFRPIRLAGTATDVVQFAAEDEPGWYYPETTLRRIGGDFSGDACEEIDQLQIERLAAFRQYLQDKGLQPDDLGSSDWGAVCPVDRDAASDPSPLGLPARRLFYWTSRFFAESAVAGLAGARTALQTAFGKQMTVYANLNNHGSRWYRHLPSSTTGGPDWFEIARTNAATLWTESWTMEGSRAEEWLYHADIMRSGSMNGHCIAQPSLGCTADRDCPGVDQCDHQGFGGYVIGQIITPTPGDAASKVLGLIGRGAKALSVWTFGPEIRFPGNAWSENFPAYGPIADALRLVGRAERLLFPGLPARASVAILLPGSSTLWDGGQRLPFYAHEVQALHHALTHAGHRVDFVDEVDVARGELVARGYRVLYVATPNVAADAVRGLGAQQAIDIWVQDGGVLAVLPGGGVADEYDTATSTFDVVLGLGGPRVAVRTDTPAAGYPFEETLPVTDSVHLTDSRFGGTTDVGLSGPLVALAPSSAAVAASFGSSGLPAITINQHAAGLGIAYGFFPGWQYWMTPDRHDRYQLPRGWGTAQRELAIAPVVIPALPRSVVASQDGVEVDRLESTQGIALVLFNWTGDPISDLTLTVEDVGAYQQATSARGVRIKKSVAGGRMILGLELADVDVISIE